MTADAAAPAPAPAPAAPAPAAAAPAAPAPATTTTTKKKTTKTKRKTKRKKTTSSSSSRTTASSAASATAIWNAAHAAQAELSQQKAEAAARKSDPLWYRIEEPVQSVAGETRMTGTSSGVLTNQVELVESALLNHNLTRSDVTPQAFACLLEQARRFALELYADAQDYAYAANRHEVSRADLLLAAELRPSNSNLSLAALQPRLSHLAQQVNRVPLPPIPTNCYHGIVLPPKEHQLTARTFDVVSGAQVAQRMVAPPPEAPAKKPTKKSKSTSKASYGAKRGQQIPIQLKESTTTTTPMDVVPAASGPAAAPAPAPTTAAPPAAPTTAGTTPPAPAAAPGAPPGTITAVPGADGGAKRKADQMST